jgi:hypothetical protein
MADASCVSALTNILPYIGPLSDRISFDKKAQKDLAKWHNEVILAAREALGIKDADDLPVLNYDNETDN